MKTLSLRISPASRAINREVLALALPSILANVAVPLIGIVDIAVAGHQPSETIPAATFIGGISIGSMIFDMLYWCFDFLRLGTSGMTAQAYGRRDWRGIATILTRGVGVALGFAAVCLLLQWVILQVAFLCIPCSPEVKSLASQYFYIRILAVPATLSLMAFRGWFIGLQDTVSAMAVDLTVTFLNVLGAIFLSLGLHGGPVQWSGIGFRGIAVAVVIAQYSGLLLAGVILAAKYWKRTFALCRGRELLREAFRRSEIRRYFSLNADLFVRSLSFIGVYIGFTLIATSYGDLALAVASILMKILMLFSYFTDGFAFAGEALVGRFVGAKDSGGLRLTVRWIFLWSAAVCLLFTLIYIFGGKWILGILTSDAEVIGACSPYMLWLYIMPAFGCIAFAWDGVYIGATAAKPIRNVMVLSTLSFLGSYFSLAAIFRPGPSLAVHFLMGAYFIHLVVRAVGLTAAYKGSILSPVQKEEGI